MTQLRSALAAGLLALALSTAGAAVPRAEIAVKNGEKIAFLGDSITQGGM